MNQSKERHFEAEYAQSINPSQAEFDRLIQLNAAKVLSESTAQRQSAQNVFAVSFLQRLSQDDLPVYALKRA